MQMSKQEKIIVFVLLILVILGIGLFVFILPNFNNIEPNQKSLDAANSSYSDILSQLEREKTIDSDIKEEYEKGKNLANGFYHDLTPVECDEIMRQFIAKGKDISINELKVGPMSTENLSISVFLPTEVTYPLKDFSNTVINGDDADIPDIENMSDREKFIYAKDILATALALSEPVTVGSSTVSFTAYSDDLQNLYDFADLLNEGVYDDTIVDENGNPQRKATYLTGAQFELTDKSADIINAAYNTGDSSQPEESEPAESETSSNPSGWGRYRMDFNVKLYSIEPVADPFANSTESAADDTTTSSDAA